MELMEEDIKAAEIQPEARQDNVGSGTSASVGTIQRLTWLEIRKYLFQEGCQRCTEPKWNQALHNFDGPEQRALRGESARI